MLTVLAVIFFVLYKTARHFEKKYARMWDGSRIAEFCSGYWRTSRYIPDALLTASIVCVWFEIRTLAPAQVVASIVLTCTALTLMFGCLFIVFAVTEFLFVKMWEPAYYSNKAEDFKVWLAEFRGDFRQNKVDTISAWSLGSLGFTAICLTLWNMATTLVLPPFR